METPLPSLQKPIENNHEIQIPDWDDLCMNDLTVKKTKVKMFNPYDYGEQTKYIEVEVQGEHIHGVPNGLCYMYFIKA